MLRRLLLLLLLASQAALAFAQQRMEVLPLRHRLAEQVLPVLQPLVEPGGVISSMSGKLIVRSSAANIEEIQQALAAIDLPVRRLQISVRQGGSTRSDETRAGVDARVRLRDGEVSVDGRGTAGSVRRESQDNVISRVQTVEDGEALIYIGQSVPLPATRVVQGPGGVVVTRGTQYVSAGTGFLARPRLAGNNVTVSIAPQGEQIQPDGRVRGGGLRTTVSGRLGEWIPLGGVSQQFEREERGTLRYGEARGSSDSDYWIRVDALD